jgi:spoIIIJ-associated protein
MRFEAKTEADAVARAAHVLGRSAAEVKYRVVRDEKSFWGGRIVEIEVEEARNEKPVPPAEPISAVTQTALDQPPAALERETTAAAEGARRSPAPVLDEEAFGAVESTLSELLSAAGFLLETRRQTSGEEMVIELIGDDVEPLLANKGEGLNGLEVLTGRIASHRLGRPVYPRLDAEGFRAHQRESLEELAHRSAAEAKRTRRAQLLPPLSPGERRLVHLALAEDPEVETESEGDGFLKRVAVKLKSR